MRRFIKDNRGMTLIELLIAITILGLVAAPLLHGFLTSAQTEVKARKMGEVTSVAQNVMEIVEGNEFDKVVQLTTYQGTGRYYTVLNDEYKSPSDTHSGGDDYHIGLTGYPMNGKSYDVMIDVEASKYSQLNDVDKLSVNSEMDHYFPIPETAVKEGKIADRVITMEIKRDTDAVLFDVKYQVTGEEEVKLPQYSHSNSKGRAAIYLFYHPSYTKDGGSLLRGKDTINIINNKDDVSFDLYIIKQRNNISLNQDIIDLEDLYECQVEQSIEEYDWNAGKIGAKIFTNLKENLGDENSTRIPEVSYKVFATNVVAEGVESTLLPFQTEGVARDRIYAVTVKVFEKGSGFAGEPLSTLKGAILK